MTILWHKLFSKAKDPSPLFPQLLRFLAAAGGCPLLDAYRSTGAISPFLGRVDGLLFSYWSILLVSVWDVKNLYCRHSMASDQIPHYQIWCPGVYHCHSEVCKQAHTDSTFKAPPPLTPSESIYYGMWPFWGCHPDNSIPVYLRQMEPLPLRVSTP